MKTNQRKCKPQAQKEILYTQKAARTFQESEERKKEKKRSKRRYSAMTKENRNHRQKL